MVFGLFAILEVVTGNFVEPWLYGIHTGVSSLALLLATVFWAALWGPAGLILSTPLTVCVLVLGRYVPQFKFLHVLLGDEAPLEAEALIYQRLLDMDEQEARSVADRYLKEHSLTQLYDLVLIPALTMAEHDRHKGALDTVREEFLFLSMKEMLAELPDDSLRLAPPNAEAAVEAVTEPKPEWPAGRVICIPANDEADEISASMLSQLLEIGGCAALSFPVEPGYAAPDAGIATFGRGCHLHFILAAIRFLARQEFEPPTARTLPADQNCGRSVGIRRGRQSGFRAFSTASSGVPGDQSGAGYAGCSDAG